MSSVYVARMPSTSRFCCAAKWRWSTRSISSLVMRRDAWDGGWLERRRRRAILGRSEDVAVRESRERRAGQGADEIHEPVVVEVGRDSRAEPPRRVHRRAGDAAARQDVRRHDQTDAEAGDAGGERRDSGPEDGPEQKDREGRLDTS